MNIKKVLLKISGEHFAGNFKTGIDFDILRSISAEICTISKQGLEISIVVGGGNIYRGSSAKENGIEREKADYIGMLATVINALSLSEFLKRLNLKVDVMSSIGIPGICSHFDIDSAKSNLKNGTIMIFAAGTGNPYFSTDTAAILKALEMDVDAVIKCTKVDGVYSDDPVKNSNAEFYHELTYDEVLSHNLGIMDLPAISLAKVNQMPIIVGSLKTQGNILNILNGNGKFSIIK